MQSSCLLRAFCSLTPGFEPDKEKALELERKLEQLALGPEDTVVLDLPSNTAGAGEPDNQ
jgi:hypothetical protein